MNNIKLSGELGINMNCVLWFLFYCIVLSTFCWLLYWMQACAQFE